MIKTEETLTMDTAIFVSDKVNVQDSSQLGWNTHSLSKVFATSFADLYSSEAVLQKERQEVFLSNWTLLGSSDALAARGSFRCFEVLGVPIVLIGQGEGVVKGFYNQCPHRALPILEGEGLKRNFITCPYHQWSLKLTGEVSTIPQSKEFDQLNKEALGLKEFDVVIWRGLIFGDLLGRGALFNQLRREIESKIGDEFKTEYQERSVTTYQIACNWKFLVENHVDVYHLWYLHSKTLNSFDHQRFRWEQSGPNWWSYEPRKTKATYPYADENGNGAKDGIGAHLLYPNIMIVTTPRYVATYDALPIDASTTQLTLRIRANEDADAEKVLEEIRAFLSEDVLVCERLQNSVKSPYYSLGPLAKNHERPILNFHDSLRTSLGV